MVVVAVNNSNATDRAACISRIYSINLASSNIGCAVWLPASEMGEVVLAGETVLGTPDARLATGAAYLFPAVWRLATGTEDRGEYSKAILEAYVLQRSQARLMFLRPALQLWIRGR